MKHLPVSIKPIYRLIIPSLLVLISSAVLAADKADQTSQTRVSSNSDFEVTIESHLDPLQLGRMHAWTATVQNADGDPVTGATINISGGMPIHNHGFPTQPEMTKELGDGRYLLQGFKFSMGGPWVIILDITSGDDSDSVAFDVDM